MEPEFEGNREREAPPSFEEAFGTESLIRSEEPASSFPDQEPDDTDDHFQVSSS